MDVVSWETVGFQVCSFSSIASGVKLTRLRMSSCLLSGAEISVRIAQATAPASIIAPLGTSSQKGEQP